MDSVQKHIFIIGSGAIGKALAVFLKLAGRKVTVIRGRVKDACTTTRRIGIEIQNGVTLEANVKITTLDSLPMIDGIVVLSNKSFGNEQLARALKGRTGNSPIVLLQNGLGIEQSFLDHGYPQLYRCVLFVTSQLINQSNIRFKPVDICPIGIERGNKDGLERVVNHLNTPNFRFRSELHLQHIIWKKAIINCVFNSICPLLEIDNGIFHRSQDALKIARRIIVECINIATEKGIAIRQDEVETGLLQISQLSEGQAISTLQDIRNKRRTEIETLNHEIVGIAEQMHQQDSVRETRLLGELIKLKSELTQNIIDTEVIGKL